ncbi:hypothetical protein AAHE18_16G147100 [Arachis hypogaea]
MKSASRYAFILGSGFSWASKKQEIVAQSSAEVEYIAAANAISQAIWLRKIFEDIGEHQKEPTTMLCDSKSTIAVANNPIHHYRTKHIAIKYHFIREAILEKKIKLEYCNTDE